MTSPILEVPAIRLDTLAPVAILRSLIPQYRERTRGMLDAEVTTVTGSDDFVIHRLDLIAPQLEGQRHRILTATHRTAYYPVVIEAACYQPKIRRWSMREVVSGEYLLGERAEPLTWPVANDWRPAANDQNEFINKVQEVLRSPEVRAIIDSLIAQTNEKLLDETEPPAAANGEAEE